MYQQCYSTLIVNRSFELQYEVLKGIRESDVKLRIHGCNCSVCYVESTGFRNLAMVHGSKRNHQ